MQRRYVLWLGLAAMLAYQSAVAQDAEHELEFFETRIRPWASPLNFARHSRNVLLNMVLVVEQITAFEFDSIPLRVFHVFCC